MPEVDLWNYAVTVLGMSTQDLLNEGITPGSQTINIPDSAVPPTTIVATGGPDTNPQSVRSIISRALNLYGLDGPEATAYLEQFLIDHPSVSEPGAQAQLELDLYDPSTQIGKVVDTKYPELQQRIKNGYARMSLDTAVGLRSAFTSWARSEHLPESVVDPGKLIANDVSPTEAKSRLQSIYRRFSDAAPDLAAQLRDSYGYTPAQIAGFLSDKSIAEEDFATQFATAEIGVEAGRTGFGMVSTAEAEQLRREGVTAGQAKEGFGQLAAQRGLFTALPGAGEDDITREEQLGAVFTNSQAAAERIRRRRERRLASFGGGGGLGVARQGLSGLGSAET